MRQVGGMQFNPTPLEDLKIKVLFSFIFKKEGSLKTPRPVATTA